MSRGGKVAHSKVVRFGFRQSERKRADADHVYYYLNGIRVNLRVTIFKAPITTASTTVAKATHTIHSRDSCPPRPEMPGGRKPCETTRS